MDKGPGLAFKAYPQALSLMPGASIWSVVFCFMLIPVALGSATCHVETVAAEFVGQFAFLFFQLTFQLQTHKYQNM